MTQRACFVPYRQSMTLMVLRNPHLRARQVFLYDYSNYYSWVLREPLLMYLGDTYKDRVETFPSSRSSALFYTIIVTKMNSVLRICDSVT